MILKVTSCQNMNFKCINCKNKFSILDGARTEVKVVDDGILPICPLCESTDLIAYDKYGEFDIDKVELITNYNKELH